MEDDPDRERASEDTIKTLDFHALSARIAELELQVAALSSAVWKEQAHPGRAVRPFQPPGRAAPPPPPALPAHASFSVKGEQSSPHSSPIPPTKSLEDRLGSQVFNLVGVVALIFGAAWGLKLAIEHGLVTPTARVLIGLLAGLAAIIGSEVLRSRRMAAFSYSLKAVGTAVLYLSLWAAFQLYGILSAPVALIGMILVTAWNTFMALSQDAELLAFYALLGALLTPLLLSTGGNHEIFLFTYIAAVDLGVVVLQRFKSWARLLLPAFAATVIYFIGYYIRFFHSYPYRIPAIGWDAQSSQTALFIILFFAIFALVSVTFWPRRQALPARETDVISSVLVPLANCAFMALGLYWVFQDSGLHTSLAWLMLALAAVFLGLMRLQHKSLASAMHLAAAVVCLTVAIPLKASGHALTTVWLVEGVVLYWAATRIKAPREAPTRVLELLALAGYALGLGSVLEHWTWSWSFAAHPHFFNANLATSLVAVVALAGAVWLAMRPSETKATTSREAVVIGALSAIDAIGLLLAARELGAGWTIPSQHSAFANPDFSTALVGLALFAATSWVSLRLSQTRFAGPGAGTFRLVACIDSILFNLIAILTIECEIGSLWPRQDADLQRSLAISGFLMFYGAILLSIGFWKRSAFIRWQALILIIFTIAKVFLYDIAGLSAGYRVASFLALGALLMTVSLAYQKDWLGLKTSPQSPLEDL